jgi:RNA polymerase sigma-54 factor
MPAMLPLTAGARSIAMQISFGQSLGHRQTLAVSQQLRQAIVLLQMGNAELQAFIERQAEENPFVELALPARPAPAPQRAAGDDDWDRIAALPDRTGRSLYVHVAGQLGAMDLGPDDLALAAVFLDELEPSGWLGAATVDIAARAGATVGAAEALLARLQRLDPAGVFARTLAECLRPQAEERGLLTPLFDAVLRHLPLLAAADIPGLARACGCAPADLRPVLRALRGLDPKPGLRFDSDPDPVRPPDLVVTAAPGGGWQVDLNRSTLPAVIVQDGTAARLTPAARRSDTGSYVAERLSLARWLARAVDHRNRTVLRIGQEVVRGQAAFFAGGPACLRPMILRDIAAAAGVHESTVSRVTGGILMATPHGTFPLKHFFTAALPARDEAGGSAGGVRHRIGALIRAEPAAAPLSDDQLVRLMQAEGIQVARRTVAKYREQLSIPASAARRRQALVAGHY